MMERMRDERGQLAAPLMLLVLALLTGGLWFFQVGRASLLQARVTTAADAGALAGGQELRRQYIGYLDTYALSGAPFVPNVRLIEAEAADYAARNDGAVTGFSVDPVRRRVTVSAANTQSMDGAYGLSDPGDRGSFTSTAEVTVSWTFGPSTFSGGGDVGSSPGGGAAAGGSCPGPTGRPGAGLNGNGGTTADYISHLDPGMAEAARQLNEAMGCALRIGSGYRSAAYQAELCPRINGPCAPPGRSMHQFGMAIDVPNWQAALNALRAHPEINICWPNIPKDPGHFSFGDGRECGGERGAGEAGGGVPPFGGAGVDSVADFNVHLVDDDYGFAGGFTLPDLPELTGNGGLGDPNDPRSWEALIDCESSGNPRAVNQQTGRHFGLLQFDIPTWQSVRGTGNPIDATPEEQLMRGRMLYDQRGWQPWECAANKGWDLSRP